MSTGRMFVISLVPGTALVDPARDAIDGTVFTSTLDIRDLPQAAELVARLQTCPRHDRDAT
jgi:hypothetical protein